MSKGNCERYVSELVFMWDHLSKEQKSEPPTG